MVVHVYHQGERVCTGVGGIYLFHCAGDTADEVIEQQRGFHRRFQRADVVWYDAATEEVGQGRLRYVRTSGPCCFREPPNFRSSYEFELIGFGSSAVKLPCLRPAHLLDQVPAIFAFECDTTPAGRGVYADWCEEHGWYERAAQLRVGQ